MPFASDLQQELEDAEQSTVGDSFGTHGRKGTFSVPRIRDWILQNHHGVDGGVGDHLRELSGRLLLDETKKILASVVRFSFLIELTDLRVGSTKMKTRWVPGYILMPQEGSFEPVRGSFEPGNDPRAATFEECFLIFETCLDLVLSALRQNAQIRGDLRRFSEITRVPYEFPFGYVDPQIEPVHRADNVNWIFNDDARWLTEARPALKSAAGDDKAAIKAICDKKLSVKVYKTDRALTGRDKTNRAKRWEVLAGDFQHATLPECWSVERRLTEQLVKFEGFPEYIANQFYRNELVDEGSPETRCPVTLAKLNYQEFAAAMLTAQHGRSDYQIGHLMPLKRGGRHIGENVSWQSADGNRIQGDLSIGETKELLEAISQRQQMLPQLA